ncbi:ATP-binding cassette domain-containing protein [Streptomyces sp. NBC_01725]|uniref:ABC transporter ATP-binding protein n=1 Tax=Streptomyces sp. NBC_01725 TaxID=2975923 RepID=UPI002E28FEAD|nr:ATP-binding cassette domain-containing protein [Streptomyces sp. NBC_01725]
MELRGVGRRYGVGGPWVLRGVDLSLPPYSLIRLEGTNGSGKSTLLRLLAGIDSPTEGCVTGRPGRTAYVPERFPVALPFTAAGYLTHMGRIHGLRGAAAKARAAEWLERFGAGGHARTALSELSKGTSQKVAVAQALLAGPELLVLDEAWTGLDSAARTQLDLAVTERVAVGGTVVFVDHDPRRLAGAADAVYTVAGNALVRGTAPGSPAEQGPRVRVMVVGPPGAAPPDGLPGAPTHERGPEDGTVLLSVAVAYSDALLRALLAARPPWHIREVRAPAEAETEAMSTARTTSTTGHATS